MYIFISKLAELCIHFKYVDKGKLLHIITFSHFKVGTFMLTLYFDVMSCYFL